MSVIVQILANAAIILGLSYLMPKIEIKSYGTAIVAALLIGVLNYTVGFIFRLPLNIITLGLMTFIIHTVITAVIIKLTDKLMAGFNVQGFTPALIIALVIAIFNRLIY
jgi:putative membrane protein